MPKICQERLQIHYPKYSYADTPEDGGQWVSQSSVRVKKGMPNGRRALKHDMDSSAEMLGSLPPGMNLEDQEITDQRVMNSSINGNYARGHNAGDFTNDEVNATTVKQGYSKKKMLMTDDQYTCEHQDVFYLDVGGFCERGNVLDRE